MCYDSFKMYTCGHSKLESRRCDNVQVPIILCMMLNPKGPPTIGGYFNHACRECTALEMEYSLAQETGAAPLPAPVVEESVVGLGGREDAAGSEAMGGQLNAAAHGERCAMDLDRGEILLKLTPKEIPGRRSTLEGLKPAEVREMLRPEVTRDRRCTLLFLSDDEVPVKLTPDSGAATRPDASARKPARHGMVLPSIMTKAVARKPVPQRSAGTGRRRTQQVPRKRVRRADSAVSLSADKIPKRSEGTSGLRKQQSSRRSGDQVRNMATKVAKPHPGDRAILPSYRYASNNGVPPAGAQILGQASNEVHERDASSQTQHSKQGPSSRAPATDKQTRRHHSDSAVHRSYKELNDSEVPARSASLDARELKKRNGVYFGNPKPAKNASDYDWLLELGNGPKTKQFTAVRPDDAGLSSPRRRGVLSGACPSEGRTYTAWGGAAP